MVHEGKKPHMCPTCGKRFGLESTLNDHLTVHNENKPFKCSICDYSTKLKQSLKKHIVAVHEKLKPHKCKEVVRLA